MTCVVITPVYLTTEGQLEYLREMVASVVSQTDDSWHLVLIDDASPLEAAADSYSEIGAALRERVTVLRLARNAGQGVCRNVGARWAWRRGLRLCLYLDCDDRADPRRVATIRSIFAQDRTIDFIYSSFDLIDENGDPVADSDVTPSIKEILDAHRSGAAQGPGAWHVIGARLGYTTLTSVVSVRTWLAVSQPFPDSYVSEDQHTWLRMTAATDGTYFDSCSRGQYRITTDGTGSNVRRRIGYGYYQQKAWVDTQGFLSAAKLALLRSSITEGETVRALSSFYVRCALTLEKEGEAASAEEYRVLAKKVRKLDCRGALRLLPVRPILFRPAPRPVSLAP